MTAAAEEFSNAARLARVHRAVVHPRHGIITSLLQHPESRDAPGLFVYTGMAVDGSYFRNNSHGRTQEARNGSGAAFERATALWATIGESLERYAAFAYAPEQMRFGTAAEFSQSVFPLDRYILFSQDQYALEGFPFHPPDPLVQRNWVDAAVLARPGEFRLVPANMVLLGMTLSSAEESIAQNSSTGLSCGPNYSAAVESALCEVIERDAFAAMWQMQWTPPRLIPSPQLENRLAPHVRRALANPLTKMTLWDITTEVGVTVVLALAEARNGKLLAVGASANLRMERAIEKAVVEALHAVVWGKQPREVAAPSPIRAEVRTPADHFRYHLRGEHRDELAFMFRESPVVDAPRARPEVRDLPSLIAALNDAGYPPLAVDLTPADLGALELCVVRALVPGLHPLLFGDGLISLDQRRLRTIAGFWGITSIPQPNLAPHPFP